MPPHERGPPDRVLTPVRRAHTVRPAPVVRGQLLLPPQDENEDATLTILSKAAIQLAKGGPENLKEASDNYEETMSKYSETPLLLNGQAAACIARGNCEEAWGLLEKVRREPFARGARPPARHAARLAENAANARDGSPRAAPTLAAPPRGCSNACRRATRLQALEKSDKDAETYINQNAASFFLGKTPEVTWLPPPCVSCAAASSCPTLDATLGLCSGLLGAGSDRACCTDASRPFRSAAHCTPRAHARPPLAGTH